MLKVPCASMLRRVNLTWRTKRERPKQTGERGERGREEEEVEEESDEGDGTERSRGIGCRLEACHKNGQEKPHDLQTACLLRPSSSAWE